MRRVAACRRSGKEVNDMGKGRWQLCAANRNHVGLSSQRLEPGNEHGLSEPCAMKSRTHGSSGGKGRKAPTYPNCWYEEPSNRPRRSRRNVKPPRDVQRDEESGKDGLPGSLQRLCFAGPETMRRGSQNCKEAREGYQRKTSAKRARENENKSFLVRSAW